MTTLTLTLDDHAARKAQQAARRRQVTLEHLLSQFIEKLGRSEPDNKTTPGEVAALHMESLFRQLSRPLDGKGYTTRDELYERGPVS